MARTPPSGHLLPCSAFSSALSKCMLLVSWTSASWVKEHWGQKSLDVATTITLASFGRHLLLVYHWCGGWGYDKGRRIGFLLTPKGRKAKER